MHDLHLVLHLQFRKRTEFLKSKQAERRMDALGNGSGDPEVDPYEPPNQGPPLGPTFDSDEQSLYYRAYEPKPHEGGWVTRYFCYSDTDVEQTSLNSEQLQIRFESFFFSSNMC